MTDIHSFFNTSRIPLNPPAIASNWPNTCPTCPVWELRGLSRNVALMAGQPSSSRSLGRLASAALVRVWASLS